MRGEIGYREMIPELKKLKAKKKIKCSGGRDLQNVRTMSFNIGVVISLLDRKILIMSR